MHPSFFFVMGLGLFAPQVLFARSDVRELCRFEVSGTYLKTQSDIDQLQGLLMKTHASLQELNAQGKLLKKKLAALDASDEESNPVSRLDEDTIALRHTSEALDAQIKETNQELEGFKAQLEEKAKFLKHFEKLIAPIFAKTKQENAAQGAYPMRLDFRHVCSEYMLLCPLPPKQATALLAIIPALQDPKDCQRYAQLPADAATP